MLSVKCKCQILPIKLKIITPEVKSNEKLCLSWQCLIAGRNLLLEIKRVGTLVISCMKFLIVQ